MSLIRKAGLTTLAAAAGAAAEYMFDPQLGRTRRSQARDQFLARVRRTGRELDRRARYASGPVAGAVKKAATSKGKPEPNDVGLARKIESIIFRPEEAPKGRVSVNVEDGVVYLRGEVESQEQIDTLLRAAEHVEGVREVRNLMHLPGTSAPSKDDPLTRPEHETISRS